MNEDFRKFAVSKGINGNTFDAYKKATNGIISPTILEERHLNVATMDIFSRLMFDRIIVLGTEINEDVANIVTSQLMYLNSVDSDSDIKLFINSPGGSVIDGLAIYDIMNWVEPDVATYTMGMAASMGSILLSSGGQYSDIKIWAEEIKKHQSELYNILAENTGKSFEQIEKDADRDHWFTAKEALEYGLIDEIIEKKK